jgi:hypothetical protein
MPTRVSKKRLDELEETNALAARIVASVTAGTAKGKNPAAVALAELGASKGGKARAASLTAKRRSTIAKKAAAARWAKK